MDIITIYESVCYASPIGENAFLEYFNRTIDELNTDYHTKYLCPAEAVLSRVNSLDEGTGLYDDYTTPVIDNILFFATGDAAHKTDFIMHKDQAYKQVWRRLAYGKRRTGDIW